MSDFLGPPRIAVALSSCLAIVSCFALVLAIFDGGGVPASTRHVSWV